MAQQGCMLKSVSSHLPCAFLIQDYLERDNGRNRALAHDFVNLYFEEQPQWAEVMDRVRRQAGNDRAWGGRQAVTYQQFIVSPSPADCVGLETLRELTMEWVCEFFGSGSERGVLGDYQVAVVYHDDNSEGIPHAHVVVNSTDLETGRRLHIDNAQDAMLADRLQDMAGERGLSFFDNKAVPKRERVFRGSFITRTERERIRNGLWCYKQDLRSMVDIAMRTSRDEAGFLAQIGRLGVNAYIKDGDYVFAHPVNPGRNHATGYRLGKAFSREALLHEHAAMALDGYPRSGRVARNVARHIGAYVAGMKTVATAAAWTTLEEAACVLRINDHYGVRSLGDYDRVEARLLKNLSAAKALGDPDAGRLSQEVGDIRQARETARDGNFFEGEGPSAGLPKKTGAAPAKPSTPAAAGAAAACGPIRSGLQKAGPRAAPSGRRAAPPPSQRGGGQKR